ncbi:MAG: DUF434 domain-containing protein [Thermoprotei archaeon]|nr:MAG: DUF434 domain-containing protein [Thermoprotei archaeon]RLF25641.1 MAG: DUF434 domain-containing protein [Thermoprotei archaeon]
MSLSSLVLAIVDMKLLLLRGYGKDKAANIVSERHSLSRRDRAILLKILHSPEEMSSYINKRASEDDINNVKLSIDGYNVLITIEAMLNEKPVVICDDRVLRDLTLAYGSYRPNEKTSRAIELLLSTIAKLRPSYTIIVYDAPVSHSGELAALTRRIMKEKGLTGVALTSRSPDKDSALLGDVVASSDVVVLKYAKRFIDIPSIIAREMRYNKVIDLSFLDEQLKHFTRSLYKVEEQLYKANIELLSQLRNV